VTALSTALAVGLITAAPAPAVTAFSAVTVSGTELFHPPPYPEQLLPGYFTDHTVINIAYPAAVFGMDASVAIAAAGIKQAMAHSVGPMVIGGYSQGAIAVTYAMRAIMALPADQRPAVDQLTFLTIGDPTGRGGILRFFDSIVPVIELTPVTMPDTPYDTVVINGEYDGWGDFPDRPWNLVSVANALLGTAYVHGHYEVIPGGLDLSGAHVSTTVNSLGGQTTTYLMPTEKLPLVQPLRDIGIPEDFIASIEAPLRAMVDAGYARHDASAAPAINPASAQRVSTAETPRHALRSAAKRGGPPGPRPAAVHALRQRGPAAAS
jgi:hypothetical protein